MPTRKKAPQTLVLDADPLEGYEQAAPHDHADDALASLCPSCGELLAWHEAPCPTSTTPAPGWITPAQPVDPAAPIATNGFAFNVGQPVQPAPDAPARPVIWRGQLKARHPRTGLVQRVNVYRLADGYWDCYYETELQGAA